MDTIPAAIPLFEPCGPRPTLTQVAHCPLLNPTSTLLPAHFVHKPNALPLPCAIQLDRGISAKLRDGATISVDVFRPPGPCAKVPAIICAGTSAKQEALLRSIVDEAPWRLGMPQVASSGLQRLGGLDPAYWCLHGYAIVHPELRNTSFSKGDMDRCGTLDGQDGYDLVEWIAQQEWSNERVGMAGASRLATTQWFVGATRPPHLTCLAPWEGCSDVNKENTIRGEVPNHSALDRTVSNGAKGISRIKQTTDHSVKDKYREERKAQLDKVEVPLYAAANWDIMLHANCSFQGFLEAGSKEKWLRVHNSHAWPDLYYPQNTEDLRKFFDHYMKNVANDWIYTPSIRTSILNPGHTNIVNRPETAFPLHRQQSVRLFLDASNNTLRWDVPHRHAAKKRFDPYDNKVAFHYVFQERTELTGYFCLRLWLRVFHNDDDVEIFTRVQKRSTIDTGSQILESMCIDPGYLQPFPEEERDGLRRRRAECAGDLATFFAPGPMGRLRVSLRELDAGKSSSHRPVYTNQPAQKLTPGGTVCMNIALQPHGMIWEEGEVLELLVAGHDFREEPQPSAEVKTVNKGEVEIMTGGDYDSHLLVPFIPYEVSGRDEARETDFSMLYDGYD